MHLDKGQEASGFRRAVELSARQLIYNIWGLKERLEKKHQASSPNKPQKELGAQALCDYWKQEVRTSAGNEMMHKKSTFDTCLTLYKRVLSIKECADIIAADESDRGPEGVWNSLFRLQE